MQPPSGWRIFRAFEPTVEPSHPRTIGCTLAPSHHWTHPRTKYLTVRPPSFSLLKRCASSDIRGWRGSETIPEWEETTGQAASDSVRQDTASDHAARRRPRISADFILEQPPRSGLQQRCRRDLRDPAEARKTREAVSVHQV